MSKFKVGDKIVWSDKAYAGKFHKESVDSVMVVKYTRYYEYSEVYFIGTECGIEAYDFRFELYEEKEMQEFDKSKLTTGMRVVHKNGKVGIVLKDIDLIAYKGGYNFISDFDAEDCNDPEGWKLDKVYQGYKANAKVLDYARLGELIWERKEETEQQKRIRELKETIDTASKQLEELMKEKK